MLLRVSAWCPDLHTQAGCRLPADCRVLVCERPDNGSSMRGDTEMTPWSKAGPLRRSSPPRGLHGCRSEGATSGLPPAHALPALRRGRGLHPPAQGAARAPRGSGLVECAGDDPSKLCRPEGASMGPGFSLAGSAISTKAETSALRPVFPLYRQFCSWQWRQKEQTVFRLHHYCSA